MDNATSHQADTTPSGRVAFGMKTPPVSAARAPVEIVLGALLRGREVALHGHLVAIRGGQVCARHADGWLPYELTVSSLMAASTALDPQDLARLRRTPSG